MDALAPADLPGRRLSGRDAEIDALNKLLASARESRSFLVAVIRGPEGVGRSSLLSEIERVWGESGIIAALIRPPASLTRQVDAALLRAGSGSSALGRDRVAALLVDDADKADLESQAQLAQFLSDLLRPAATRASEETLLGGVVVLVVGERPLGHALQESLARAQPTTLTLAPFDAQGLRRYLSEGSLTARLLDATGGVPARLEELLSGTVDLTSRRVERLSPADRDLLSVLAVLSRPEPSRFVALIAGSQGVSERLKSLTDSGWIASAPDLGKTHFGLAREADRRALLAALAPSQVVALHRSVGLQYAAVSNDEAAFQHLCSAGETARSFDLGLRLGDRFVQQGSVVSAEAVLTTLSELPLDRDQRRSVQLRLADVLEKRGSLRGALAALGRARGASIASQHPPLRAKAARLCVAIGASAQAERLSRRALDADPQNTEAIVAFADARFLRGAYDEAIAFAESQARLPPQHRAALENVRGKALLTLGRLDEARKVFQSNAVRAEAAGLSVEGVRALLNVGVVAHRQGNLEEAKQAYAAALASGDAPFTPIVRANLASLHFEEGEVELAISEAHRAVAAFVSAGRAKEESHATQNLARFYLFAGDVKRATEIAHHARQIASRVGDPYLIAGAQLVGAEASFRRGESAALASLQTIASEFERLGNQRYRCEALLLVAEAHLATKSVSAARAALAEAKALSIRPLMAEWNLLNAEVALRSDEESTAAEALRLAREALVATPHVELPARLYSLSAQLADRHGDVSAAQAERLKAVSILERLASKVPLDLRNLFFARSGRRAIVEQAGRFLPEVLAPSAAAVVSSSTASALVGQAASIVRINQLVDRIGPSSATVLVRGESGTGKELVARALHERSPRRDLPLVAVNCGALSEELLLSELFGHERGAFTGAIRERKGRFELAAGGTIFLDEIGDISPRAQVALLRVLQERTFERIGGSRTISVDVRVVCATNRPLEELMKKGQFREDLYYRLRGTTLTLPPLREHLEDLPLLCDTFLGRLDRPLKLSREALGMLERHPWAGNVRELFHMLESASILATGGSIGPEAFELYPELFQTPAALPKTTTRPAGEPSSLAAVGFYEVLKQRDLSLKDFRRELDLACISEALQEAAGNISEAARLLKMKRSRLSQVVNAEPSLRVLCRGPVNETSPDDGDEEDGPILAGEAGRRRNGAVE
jgi:transcriptional regulator with GAF, ATPase, and Fis domain/tetratricopeptide (TPR) repeat protein